MEWCGLSIEALSVEINQARRPASSTSERHRETLQSHKETIQRIQQEHRGQLQQAQQQHQEELGALKRTLDKLRSMQSLVRGCLDVWVLGWFAWMFGCLSVWVSRRL